MSKILPCPNCGNKEDFSLNCGVMHGPGPDLFEAHVQCLDCDLSTGTACPFVSKEGAEAAAIHIWNEAVNRMVSSDCAALLARHAALVDAQKELAALKADYDVLHERYNTAIRHESIIESDYNALVAAVEWEREFDEVLVWLVQTGRYPRDMGGKYDLANERECARADVDRLIGGE